jgi:hypothetical protein
VANLNQEQLRRLARLGAMARLDQLRQEEQAIRAEFPELFGRGRRAESETPGTRRPRGNGAAPKASGRTRRRRGMSAAQRKAVSERMRKYWAERRKAKGSR